MTDTSTGGSFDPRFNPAFQPGYDPSQHARPPVVADRASAPELIEHPLALPPDPGGLVPDGALPAGASGNLGEYLPVARRFDPYLIGLWALSLVFVAAGLFTIRYIADRMDGLSASGTAFSGWRPRRRPCSCSPRAAADPLQLVGSAGFVTGGTSGAATLGAGVLPLL
jgi:hypothetical protein